MTRLALRVAVFVCSSVIAAISLIVFTVTAFLTMSPPLIGPELSETIRTWGGMTMFVSALIAVFSYDARWEEQLRRIFKKR